MSRSMLLPVYFRAPHGGLHLHVREQVKAALAADWQVTLVCPGGPFADEIESQGVTVERESFSDVDAAARRCAGLGQFDLVNAHPWASFRVGHATALELACPLVVTRHNVKMMDLVRRADDVDLVVCVSEHVRDAVVRETRVPPFRVKVVRNGSADRAGAAFRASGSGRYGSVPSIAVLSRYDRDKSFLVDILLEVWQQIGEAPGRLPNARWEILGDGDRLPDLQQAAARLTLEAPGNEVIFRGWVERDEVRRNLARTDVVIAPGMGAIDAVAAGAIVVAVGGRGYVGLLDGEVALQALSQNFGSQEDGFDGYQRGKLLADIVAALDPDEAPRRQRVGQALLDLHDPEEVARQHQRLWELVAALPPAAGK